MGGGTTEAKMLNEYVTDSKKFGSPIPPIPLYSPYCTVHHAVMSAQKHASVFASVMAWSQMHL